MAINTIKVKAQNRTELGSRAMKRIRDKGMIPAVIYGHKQAVLPITLDKREVSSHINKGAHLFDLDVAGTSETVLVKEAQYDHLGIQLLHVDFSRVSLDEKVKVKVPLELKGTPKGEAEGGKLQQLIAELDVECVVVSIPELIRHTRRWGCEVQSRGAPVGRVLVLVPAWKNRTPASLPSSSAIGQSSAPSSSWRQTGWWAMPSVLTSPVSRWRTATMVRPTSGFSFSAHWAGRVV